MYLSDSIAAIATAHGPGAIGIVRVSGGEAEAIAQKVFRGTQVLQSHRLYHGQIVDADGRAVDDALAVMMRAPHSYTGEDILELHCHGSPAVLRSVLEAVLAAGAR